MKPVISVIFTAGSGVETCRAKLAGQTFKEYEIIEADRFAGIERAHGEYILFVDGSRRFIRRTCWRSCMTPQSRAGRTW